MVWNGKPGRGTIPTRRTIAAAAKRGEPVKEWAPDDHLFSMSELITGRLKTERPGTLEATGPEISW